MDHDALKWNLNLAYFKGRFTRRRLRLSELDFEVVHRTGAKHQAVNALLRLAINGKDTSPLEVDIQLLAIYTPIHIPEDKSTNDAFVASAHLLQLLTLTGSLCAQASDTYCFMGHAQVGHPNSEFNVNANGILD